MTDNKQLTAVELLNKIEPNGELLGTDKAIEFAIEYFAQQNAELIKKVEQLSGVIDSQKQTAGALVNKCNGLKEAGSKMAEVLKGLLLGVLDRESCEIIAAETLSHWEKLNN